MSNINNKSFNLLKRVEKTFTILIADFSIATTFIASIRIPKIKIEAVMKLASAFVSTIKLGKISLSFSSITMQQKPSIEMLVKMKLINIRSKLQELWTTGIISGNAINIPLLVDSFFKLTEKWNLGIITSTITISPLPTVFTMSIGKYKKLSYLDPTMLSSMDTQTLSELDLIIT